MIKNKETFLKELVFEDALKQNLIALIFAFNSTIDISKKEKFFDNIFPFYKRYKTEDRNKIVRTSESKDFDQWKGKDLRIKKIKLKSIRGFPDNAKPYGIEFLNEKQEPQSMIILGGNGFGKSSVFGSLEYIFCKRVSEAQLRTKSEIVDDNEEYRRFLAHFDNGFSNAYCVVDTVNDAFTLKGINIPESIRQKINPQTHFISDCDIYEFCKLDYNSGDNYSFHNLVAQSLGLKDLLEFERHLNAFINYRRITEQSKIRAFENTILQDEELVKLNNASIVEKQAAIRRIEHESSQPQTQRLSKATDLLPKLKLRSFTFTYDYSVLRDSIDLFRDSYKRLLVLGDQNHTISQAQFLKLGLELAKSSDDCPLCNNSVKSKPELINYLEQKLKEIENYNAANHEVTRAFNHVRDRLEILNNSLALFKANVQNEFEEIREVIEFSELTVRNSNMLLMLNTQMVNDFFSLIINAKENPRHVANPFDFFDSVFDIASEFIRVDLEDFLRTVATYAEERDRILREIEESIVVNHSVLNASEQLAVLNSEVKSLVEQNERLRRRIEDNKTEVINLRLTISHFNKVKDDVRDFFVVYHAKLNKEVQAAFQPIQEIVTKIINDYLKNDERNIELKVAIEPEEIDAETGEPLSKIIVASIVHKEKPEESFPVNRCFNTFHYRLFATMVGISVAIASRINAKINLPLILDDIFYASDFENRTTIERFLENIFNAFEQYTPQLPLQLIMFTHDQLIFETVIHLKQKEPDSIGFAKMFSFKEAKEKPDYMDLIYKYPHHLPKSILNNLITSYVA